MAADCKSAALRRYGGSNPSLPTSTSDIGSGSPRGARGDRSGRRAHVAQAVEHVLGKDGVSSSILLVGSRLLSREIGPPGERAERRGRTPRAGVTQG